MPCSPKKRRGDAVPVEEAAASASKSGKLDKLDGLSRLPAELLEVVLKNCGDDVWAPASLACVNSTLRASLSLLEFPWQKICEMMGEAKRDGDTWLSTYRGFVRSWHHLRNYSGGPSTWAVRCFKDLPRCSGISYGEEFKRACQLGRRPDTSGEDCKGCFPVPGDPCTSFLPEGCGWEEVEKEGNLFPDTRYKEEGAWKLYEKVKLIYRRGRKTKGKEVILSVSPSSQIGFAYNDDFAVTSHAPGDGHDCTFLSAWKMPEMTFLGKGKLPNYELPYQNLALWKNYFLFIPFWASDTLLEACDMTSDFSVAGKLFLHPEDERSGKGTRFERLTLDSAAAGGVRWRGAERIFVHGDRAIFLDFLNDCQDEPWLTVVRMEEEGQKLKFHVLRRVKLPMSKDANEFRSPNFCASQHGPNVALALFYVLLVGNPEHDAQPRPQLQSYVVCANMESLAVRVVDPGKEAGNVAVVDNYPVRCSVVEVSSYFSMACTSHTYEYDGKESPGSRPLIENDPRNLRIGGEGFPGAVPEVVLLATEGPSMLKIGGGTEGVKGLLNFPGLERELKPSMWSPWTRSWDRREVTVVHGTDVAVALLRSAKVPEKKVVVGVNLVTMEQLWQIDATPPRPQNTLPRLPLISSRFGLLLVADATRARLISARTGKEVSVLQTPAYKKIAKSENVEEEEINDHDAMTDLWDAALVRGGRVLNVYNLLRFAPLAFDLLG